MDMDAHTPASETYPQSNAPQHQSAWDDENLDARAPTLKPTRLHRVRLMRLSRERRRSPLDSWTSVPASALPSVEVGMETDGAPPALASVPLDAPMEADDAAAGSGDGE